MHKINSLTTMSVGLALAAGLTFSSSSSAFAKGFSTDTKNLPDASSIYPSKLKMQIIDTDPEVKDFRKAKENTVYQINIPPMPQSTTHVVQIGAPVNGAADGGGTGAGSNPILQPALPFAGSHSNISPHQSLANQLPNGTSSQGLRGTLARKPVQTPAVAASAPMAKLPSASSARPTAVAVYPTSAPSSSFGQTQTTKTTAYGSLLHQDKAK